MYPFIEVSETPTFGNCVLHSPFIVAIRSTTPTDSEVLEVLGLSHYRAGWLRGRSSSKEVLITNAGEWTLVADDWHYTIWHADNVWDAAVESSSYNDRRVRRNEGMPLPGETAELYDKDAMIIVWTIAQTLGILVDPQTTVSRRYAPVE